MPPATRVNAFDASVVDASELTFSASVKIGELAEHFLQEAGLGGAAVYDLRALEQETNVRLASATDDELGNEEDELLALQGGLHPGAESVSRQNSFAVNRQNSFASRRQGSFVASRQNSFAIKRQNSFASSRQSSFGGSRASSFKGSRQSSVSVLGDDAAPNDFEQRAQRLADRRSVSTKDSLEEAQLRVAVAIDKKRLPHPRPTPISDMEQVLSWLDRHLTGAELIVAAQHQEEAIQNGSGMEGMLAAWKKRAARKVVERNSTATGGKHVVASPVWSGSPASPQGDDGKWLADLSKEMDNEAIPEAQADVWERQRALEVRIAAQIEQRDTEKQQRRRAVRAAREERRKESSDLWGDPEEEDDDDEDGDESDDDNSRAGVQRTLNQMLKDESVQKFMSQLPALEARKAKAKEDCFAAERALRQFLGRKPAEVERRDDEAWGKAAMAFKEADQALFVARSLCSWDE